MVGLAFRHASDGGVDGYKLGDGPSLVPSRISPFICWAAKALTDRQVSDGPSWGPSPTPRFLAPLFKANRVDDDPLGKR
ncbi:hypothetical protein HAX54_036155, partial [Datura stramonium]|nr:hypothetical protein [Datura stramonium]